MENNRQELTKKIFTARSRILYKNGFFGNLLLSLKLAYTTDITTAATDGKYIYFNEEFMSSLTMEEIEFILMHEIMHVALNHMERSKGKNQEIYNIAADIVINSNIKHMNGNSKESISIHGTESMNLVPADYSTLKSYSNEGYLFTTEEVYNVILTDVMKHGLKFNSSHKTLDDHSIWSDANTDEIRDLIIRSYVATKHFSKIGNMPGELETYLGNLVNPQIDWRVYLNDFIQDEIYDYSFTPPDNRYNEFDFFLPGFNERDERIENIVFAIDTSGSMSDEDIKECFSEINGAISQYNGKIKGYLIEFDYNVQAVYEIDDDFDIETIKVKGRGGTNFRSVTNYIKHQMGDIEINKLIMLTDGECEYLDKDDIGDIKLLYILTYDNNDKPEIGEYTILHND